MERLVFADGDKFGVFDGEKTEYYESSYILRYREEAANRYKNDEWKYTGDGAVFRGDYETYKARGREQIHAYINGVGLDGDTVIYSFTVNGSSGVYRKELTDKKAQEEHILSSAEVEILSVYAAGNVAAVTVKNNDVTSSVGILDVKTSELKTLTGGDSRDSNASFSKEKEAVLYFDSAGVGLNANGEFTGKYAPSALFEMNLNTMEIKEVFGDKKNSYVKPKEGPDGALYCIERPAKEKRGGNPLLEILLIPVRIFQAIAMFIQAFVVLFTGKSLTSAGANPAKGKNTDSRKLYIDGNRLDAEKELKRNKRFKEKEVGFIPMSWKLVRICEGKAEVLKSGICDFAFTKDSGIYCTNGKHIFYLKDGKSTAVVHPDMCLSLATENDTQPPRDLFGF